MAYFLYLSLLILGEFLALLVRMLQFPEQALGCLLFKHAPPAQAGRSFWGLSQYLSTSLGPCFGDSLRCISPNENDSR